MPPVKYFVFNKIDDYRRGFTDNVFYQPDGLRIKPEAGSSGGVFYSRLLDSRKEETIWHRLVVRSESVGDASIRFTFYVSEERLFRRGEEVFDLEDFIKDPNRTFREKERIFQQYKVKTMFNPKDALLHEAKGRYLWFCVELYGHGGVSPIISHIKIFLPKRSWLDYLPEVSQSDQESMSFVERYLNIFQSIYEDTEEEIKLMTRNFDADVAEGDFLKWLAQWVAIDDAYIWSEDKLRHLIKNSRRFYKMRGTRQYMAEVVELYLGVKPCIVEHYQLEGYEGEARSGGLIFNLFGENSYYFTVIVSEESVPSTKEYKTLLKIIENAKPAHTEANVVVLKPYIFLDKHSYLGINSVLGQYRPTRLDGMSAIPFTVLS